jgi:hypothetical protein
MPSVWAFLKHNLTITFDRGHVSLFFGTLISMLSRLTVLRWMMLEHLRLQAMAVLAPTQAATLSTSGPAGIQARIFPCEAQNLTLYFLVPNVSDQLLNLEHDPMAMVSTTGWQMRGYGRILPLHDAPTGLTLPGLPEASGCVLVEIRPFQLQINQRNGWGYSETIDLN